MNQTHIHLLITHLPIYGSILGALVLAYGLWVKSYQTKIAAYCVFIIAAIGAGIAYLTGEAAEETVEDIRGVPREAIEQHEDFAVYALVSIIILAVASFYGIFVTLRKSPHTKKMAIVILLISLLSWGLVVRTGYLVGQIRHTEINNANPTPHAQPGDETESTESHD